MNRRGAIGEDQIAPGSLAVRSFVRAYVHSVRTGTCIQTSELSMSHLLARRRAVLYRRRVAAVHKRRWRRQAARLGPTRGDQISAASKRNGLGSSIRVANNAVTLMKFTAGFINPYRKHLRLTSMPD